MFSSGYLEQFPGIYTALVQNRESMDCILRLKALAPDSMTYSILRSIEQEKKKHYSFWERLYIETAVLEPTITSSDIKEEETFFEILRNMIFIESDLIDTYKNLYTEMSYGDRDKIFVILVEEISICLKLNWIFTGNKK